MKEIIQIDPESQMPIVQPQQATTLRERYGLRGGRLVAVLAMLVTLIAICVACKRRQRRESEWTLH